MKSLGLIGLHMQPGGTDPPFVLAPFRRETSNVSASHRPAKTNRFRLARTRSRLRRAHWSCTIPQLSELSTSTNLRIGVVSMNRPDSNQPGPARWKSSPPMTLHCGRPESWWIGTRAARASEDGASIEESFPEGKVVGRIDSVFRHPTPRIESSNAATPTRKDRSGVIIVYYLGIARMWADPTTTSRYCPGSFVGTSTSRVCPKPSCPMSFLPHT